MAYLGPLPTLSSHIERYIPLTSIATPRVGSKFGCTTQNQVGSPNSDFDKKNNPNFFINYNLTNLRSRILHHDFRSKICKIRESFFQSRHFQNFTNSFYVYFFTLSYRILMADHFRQFSDFIIFAHFN